MKKIFFFLLVLSLLSFISCRDYGYNFHFSVAEGSGEIVVDPNDTLSNVSITLCKDTRGCELHCSDNSLFCSLLGKKKGARKLTFMAIPSNGYQVKEWTFNGVIVEGNKSNYYTAIVSSEMGYNGVITVKFEKINDECK